MINKKENEHNIKWGCGGGGGKMMNMRKKTMIKRGTQTLAMLKELHIQTCTIDHMHENDKKGKNQIGRGEEHEHKWCGRALLPIVRG